MFKSPRANPKQYMKVKPSRHYIASYGRWVFKPKSNTNSIIENIAKGKPVKGMVVYRHGGTIKVEGNNE